MTIEKGKAMPVGKEVKIEVDGVEVDGRVRMTCCDIDVAITKPFHWLSGGSHIMALARGRISFDGEYGDACAEGVLKELYHLGCFLQNHMEALQREYNKVCEQMTKRAHDLRIPDFSEDKAALHERMKSGEIDSATYQRLFTPLCKKKEDYFFERRMAEDAFFEEQFPEVVPHGTRRQVLDIVKEPKLLLYGTTGQGEVVYEPNGYEITVNGVVRKTLNRYQLGGVVEYENFLIREGFENIEIREVKRLAKEKNMSEPDKNKRVEGVKWERPQEYTKGLYAVPIPSDPDAPAPLFWVCELGDELFFVNSTDTTLGMVSATLGGFETCDDDVVTVGNGKGYTYKDVRPDEAVKIEKVYPIADSDYVFQITIHIVSDLLGKMKITPPTEKEKVSGQVLLWDNNEPGKNISIQTLQE